MAGLIASSINPNPQFDLEDYERYKKQMLLTPKVWTSEQLDHLRLPGQIDICELLIYIGKRFSDWLKEIGYTGEIPSYSASYPDIIYSMESTTGDGTAPITNDSPQVKIPMLITYSTRYRSPATMTPQPFGSNKKQWNFRNCGEFKCDNGDVYIIKERFIDNLVEFTVVARSGIEADWLVQFFETFMDLNQSYFQAAGLNKMAYYARTREQDESLEKSGFMHYRKTLFFMRTQEFKFTGPIGLIDNVDIEISPLDQAITSIRRNMNLSINKSEQGGLP